MTEGAPAIALSALWKRFGYRSVLAAVDLEVPRGACLAILGANGAGKSTLLRIVATLVKPSSGRLEVFGVDALKHPLQARQRLGLVLHEPCLRLDLSLEENLRYFAALHAVADGRARMQALIERVGLADRRRDLLRHYSRGMLQRAALARSLLHDPALWLLDEPFTGLDPQGQALLAELIQEEHRRGRTIAFVSHDLELGLRLATDAVLLAQGAIAARGKDAVRGAPAGLGVGAEAGAEAEEGAAR